MLTYFVVQTFQRSPRGIIYPEEPRQVQSAEIARRTAARLASEAEAVVAFSRTGDPTTGDFDDAVIIANYGIVPWELTEHALAS